MPALILAVGVLGVFGSVVRATLIVTTNPESAILWLVNAAMWALAVVLSWAGRRSY